MSSEAFLCALLAGMALAVLGVVVQAHREQRQRLRGPR